MPVKKKMVKKKTMKKVAKKKVTKKIPNILLYRTQSCPYCHMAEDFFKANKISFKSIDVGTNVKAAQEMVKKSGQMGVPVIDINGEIIVGFDKAALKKVLKL